MKRRTKCYIYTRVSTSMQVDGYSLDAQKDKLRKYAEYEDMTIVGEYSDEGFSGKNIQGRLEFQRMLNDIQEGKDNVSFVLVFKLSRKGYEAPRAASSAANKVKSSPCAGLPRAELSSADVAAIDARVSHIKDEGLQRALKSAMGAGLSLDKTRKSTK